MKRFFQTELTGIYLFLKRNKDETVVIGAAMLFLCLHSYHPLWHDWFSNLVYYVALPVLTLLLVLRQNPLDSRPQVGGRQDMEPLRRRGVPHRGANTLRRIAQRAFQKYYTAENFNFLSYSLANCAGLFASEYFFRGFLIFGLKRKLGEASILIQTIPSCWCTWASPSWKTLSTILTGILFGYIAYRGRSFWPAFIIHLFIKSSSWPASTCYKPHKVTYIGAAWYLKAAGNVI
jgi:membrane protease YdiL (CAAX protease family)